MPESAYSAQLRLLRVAFWILLASGVSVMLLPIPLPLPVRVAVGVTDLVAASVVWLARRQRLARLRDGSGR
jgi:hypothetical protein